MLQSKQFRSLIFFAIISALTIATATGAKVSSQEPAAVPEPPISRADRFGVYNWGIDYAAYPQNSPANSSVDRLNWGADRVAEIGTRTIRVAMPGDIYQVGQMSDDLAQAAASPAYDKLFSDPRFKTYLLTCKSSTEVISPWADGYTQSESNAVRDEFTRLGEYLLANPKFAGKTFIIFNWEGDNGMAGYQNKQTIWDAFTAWIQSRTDGIKLARERNPKSQVRLFTGLEFNIVKNLQTGILCGTAVADPLQEDPLKHRCVIDYVAPRVDVDYYSYSSWLTLDVKFQGLDASYKDALKTDLTFALSKVRERRPEVTEANFIIGEYGIHRTRWGETNVANFINEMIDAFDGPDGFKVSYAIFWQIVDNGPTFWVGEDGYGLFKSRYEVFSLTRAGETFKRRLAGQSVEKWTGGPFIRRDPIGLTDAQTGSPEIKLGSLIKIEAKGSETPFSSNGNRVVIEQGIRQSVLPRDNPAGFTESTAQITATLPAGLRPGPALIYVVDQNGVESQGIGTLLKCAECPEIGAVSDFNQVNEFSPGVGVLINGRQFSASGNKVIVEQQTEQQVKYRFAVSPEEIIRESAGLILVRNLPKDLIISRFTAIIVTDAAGRDSNEYPIRVYAERFPGPPVIIPVAPFTNRDDGTQIFTPGARVSIRGVRFGVLIASVIVEQGDQRYTLIGNLNPRDSFELFIKLPDEIKPGRAQIYVIAEGESRAVEIKIARSIKPIRPPIRRGRQERLARRIE